MATVTYNGVTITNCLTKQFVQVNQYDDSETDLLFQRFMIRVVGYCHSIQNSTTVSITPQFSATAAGNARVIRQLLLEPRNAFSYSIGGAVLVSTAAIDLDNGPKPLSVEVSRVSPAVLKIEFSIQFAIGDCATAYNTKGVLSNRWGISESIDENHFTTRIVSGRLRISTVSLDAHAFRGWVVPLLQPNFARQSINVNSSTDGLTLDYSIVDRQQYAAPPAPAVRWGGTHSMSTGEGGFNTFGEVSVWLEGDAETDKAALIGACASVALRKLDILNKPHVQGDQGYFLKQVNIVDTLDQNRVEMQVRVQYMGDKRIPGVLGPNSPTLGKTLDKISQALPGYDPAIFPVPKIFGSVTPVGRFLCFLQSPCDDAHEFPKISAKTPTEPPSPSGGDGSIGNGTAVSTTEGDIPDDPIDSQSYSDSAKAAMYTYYAIDSEYQIDNNKVQLPSGASTGEDTCKIVQLFRPTAKRYVKVYAERVSDWPEMPKPQDYVDGSLKGTLLTWRPKPKAPELTADGETLLYAAEVEYWYAMNRVPTIGESLRAGSMPYMSQSLIASASLMPASAFIENIA